MTALTDSFGNIIKDYDYNPYGVEEPDPVNKFGKYATISLWQQEIETIDNPFRYCGEYYDEETGSIYLRARSYDPALGRFTQEDSYNGNIADPQSLNVYTYCYNNPIRFFDPTGNVVTDWDKEHLTPEDQKKIEQYTREYIAGNYNAHYKAEEIRNKYRKKRRTWDWDGNTTSTQIGFADKIYNSDTYQWFEDVNPVAKTGLTVVGGHTAALVVSAAIVMVWKPHQLSLKLQSL